MCYLSTVGGYHDACGDIMSPVGDVQYRGGTQKIKDDIPHGTEYPHGTHDIPHGTEHDP